MTRPLFFSYHSHLIAKHAAGREKITPPTTRSRMICLTLMMIGMVSARYKDDLPSFDMLNDFIKRFGQDYPCQSGEIDNPFSNRPR